MENETIEKYGVELEAETSGFKKQMQELADISKKTGQEIKNNLNLNVKEQYLEYYDIKQQFKKIINTPMKDQTADTIKERINILKEYIDFLKTAEEKYKDVFSQEKGGLGIQTPNRASEMIPLIEEVKKLEELYSNLEVSEQAKEEFKQQQKSLKKLKQEAEETGNAFSDIGTKISKGFSNVNRNIKRITLSMVGVHSAYMVLSRAVSTYAQYDTEYTNKMKSAWAGLGAFLAPIVSYIGTLVQKAVGYLNVFITALTGTNYLKKANDAYKYSQSIKAIGSSAKEATKSLTAMDEITNLQEDSVGGGGGISDDFNPFQALEEVELDENWVKTIQNIGEALRPVYETIKDIVKWCLDNPEVLLGLLGAVAVVKAISSILGIFSGVSAAKGLLGILGVIGLIAGIGEIVLRMNGSSIGEVLGDVRELYEKWKELGGAWEKQTGKYDELNEKNKEYAKSIDKLTEADKNKLEADRTKAKNIIEDIGTVMQEYSDMGVFGRLARPEHAKTLLKEFESDVAGVKAYIDYQKDLLDQGKLTSDEIAELQNVIDVYNNALAFADIVQNMAGVEEYTKKIKDEFKSNNKTLDTTHKKLKTVDTDIKNLPDANIKIRIDDDEARLKLNNLKNALEGLQIGAISGGVGSVRSYDVGTPYVPEDGLAMIHKGERIIPAKYNNENLFNNNNETTNELLIELIQTVEEASDKVPVLNINGREFARVTYNDFKDEENRLNRNTNIRRA